MPNRSFKGGKKKTRGKKVRGPRSGPFVLKGDSSDIDQLYGKVIARLGGKPPILEIKCEDGKSRTCVVRGKMIKKCYCNPGDIVLINYNKDLPGGEVEKKYSEKEVTKLKRLGEINNETFGTTNEIGDEDVVNFTETSDNSIINSISNFKVREREEENTTQNYEFNFDGL